MSVWRGRKGEPITREEAMRLFRDGSLRVVGKATVGDVEVSTVHLVVGHLCNGCE